MRLAKVLLSGEELRMAVVEDDHLKLLDLTQVDHVRTFSDVLHAPDPIGLSKFLIDQTADPVGWNDVQWLAPIDRQEVWAAGVTYQRSQKARMEESESAASHYDQVYTADRPELFFKGMPRRVSGPGEPVRVRADSNWSVPEPEFALVISPDMRIVGHTVGNDMSARDIEGENPLYLPQAKVYNQCCGLGPCVQVADPDEPLSLPDTAITLRISRNQSEVFHGETNLGELARSLEGLVGWLGRDHSFPDGVILLTGTGIIPPDEFTLEDGDSVSIEISGIGTLINPVVKG